jgi:hypothetical protein
MRARWGVDAAEPLFEDTNLSARRQASEQYVLLSVCLSHIRQKSGEQPILEVIVCVGSCRSESLCPSPSV